MVDVASAGWVPSALRRCARSGQRLSLINPLRQFSDIYGHYRLQEADTRPFWLTDTPPPLNDIRQPTEDRLGDHTPVSIAGRAGGDGIG